MRKRILLIVAASLYYSGLVALARSLTERTGQRIVVLNYHRASGGSLRRHLLYLRRHYRIMHAEAALEELYGSRKAGQRSSDRRIPLVLTFDDGYRDNYTDGYKLAQELQTPFTLYLIPSYIDSGAYFWWLEGKRLVKRAEVREATFADRIYHLEDAEDRAALARYIDGQLRHARSVAERETFLAEAYAKLQVPASSVEEELPALPLSWDEVREMDESGLVSFGGHTMHHPILAYLSDAEEVQHEITDCRAALEEKLGRPIRTFAYPVGQRQHISHEVIEAVKQAGFTWAFTTNYGLNRPESDQYLLKRVEVDVDQHWLIVAVEAAGLWGFFSRLRWLPFIRKHFTNSGR
jgi:peptidoglycan/xylan/chitin deacetylase (PgdA/CDA1 family)